MKKNELAAVITGDIIQSSLLGQNEKQKMLATLRELIVNGKEDFTDWDAEIFQGDSFQGSTVSGVKNSLQFAVRSIAACRAKGFGIRIAIGIGNISFASPSVKTSDGTAFLHSGRTLEDLKKRTGALIGIKTGTEDPDAEFDVHCASLNFLLARCTQPQAGALSLAIKGLTQVQIAENLQVSQPTVQQRLKAAGWPVFKAILQRFASKY